MSNTIRERLEELCLLATQGGDPIREPRRSHIARYYCALSEAWLKGDLVPAPAVPDDVAALVADAWTEAQKAMRKFPQPNYVISKVAEEAGEVVKAAIHCAEGREKPEAVRAEMVQCIAMLFRLYVEGDQVHGFAALTHPTGEPT